MGFWCFFKTNILKIIESKCEPWFYRTSSLKKEVSALLRPLGDKLEHQSGGGDFPALPTGNFWQVTSTSPSMYFPICTEVTVPAFLVNQFQFCGQSSGHSTPTNCVFRYLAWWRLTEILILILILPVLLQLQLPRTRSALATVDFQKRQQ